MRSELFRDHFSNWPAGEIGEKAAPSDYPRAQGRRLQEILRQMRRVCGSLAVLPRSFCDRARRGREFQEGSAPVREVSATVP